MSSLLTSPPAPGAVLLCNIRLIDRTGTEVVTSDLALGLARRGWRVTVYSPVTGALADALSPHVEVVAEIGRLSTAPDVIHGNHNPTLAAAMARFPSTPALQICHDARDWKDAALRFTRVRQHAAVDRACQARIAAELDCAPDQVALLPNAIDLNRCRPRGPLPERPARVLIVANRDGSHVAAVRQACELAGLEHRAVGYGVGQPAFDLEADMAWADIVVGAARIALEAMAVGCAALVCDARGLAGMATAERFDLWRDWNFGHRLLVNSLDPQAILAALATYDARDAEAVSARARADCGLDPALDRLEAAYHRIQAIEANAGPVDGDAEALIMARYLQGWLPLDPTTGPFAAELVGWRDRAVQVQRKLEGLIETLARRGQTVSFQEGPDG